MGWLAHFLFVVQICDGFERFTGNDRDRHGLRIGRCRAPRQGGLLRIYIDKPDGVGVMIARR